MLNDSQELIKFIDQNVLLKNTIAVEQLALINYKNKDNFPIYAFDIGSKSSSSPVCFLVGGFHGLERIGS